MAVIELKNVKKTYEKGGVSYPIIKGVSLAVDEGEFVSIVGESGSGKSTLLYLMSGIERADEGEVKLLGADLSTASEKELAALRRSGYSFVFQFDNLLPNLTIIENIELPLYLAGKKPSRDETEQILAFMDIEKVKDKYPREVSGGEQQRAAVARALITSPKIIFLDEPTGSLDQATGERVMELIKSVNSDKGIAIVLVTHSEKHSAYASRIIRIADGLIVGGN